MIANFIRRHGPLVLVLDAAGIYLVMVGLYATVQGWARSIQFYDEGILLSHTNLLVRHGAWPHRDFYTNYSPGIYFVLALVWKLFGVSVAAARVLGFTIHIVLAVLAGRLAGRLTGISFSWLAAGWVLVWWSIPGLPPFAWLFALAAAMGSVLAVRWAAGRWTRLRCVLCGACFGLVGCFRHELFVYLVLGAIPAGCVFALVVRHWNLRRIATTGGFIALGAAIPLALVWLPLLAHAPLARILDDLAFDQARYVLPARSLPLPPFFTLQAAPHVPFALPALLVKFWPAAAALALAGPFVAAIRLARRRSLESLFTVALCLSVLPQLLARSDSFHALFAAAPGMVVVSAALHDFARGTKRWYLRLAIVLAVLWLVLHVDGVFVRPHGALRRQVDVWESADDPRLRGSPAFDMPAQREMVEEVRRSTRPDEPVFIGNTQHENLIVNEVHLYFLVDRPAGTRYLQYDPNIVTREEVQREMIAQLEEREVRLVVLGSRCNFWEEENQSSAPGASLLDEYIQENFREQWKAGPYTVLRRGRAP